VLYLTVKDARVLKNVLSVLTELNEQNALNKEQTTVYDEFLSLVTDSAVYTSKCREKAKKFVQEKRKIDKSYAHKKKEK